MLRTLVCLLALLGVVSAQADAPPPSRDLAAEIAAISLSFAGGHDAHAALRGLRAKGYTLIAGQRVDFVLHAARPDLLHVETLDASGGLVRATDGVHLPWRSLAGGPPSRMSDEDARDFMAEADFDSPFFEPTKRGLALTHLGSADLAGRPAQRLRLVDRAGQVSLLYMDDESRMLVRREIGRQAGGRDYVIATAFDEFEPCAGVLLPRVIRTYVNNRLANETRITSIEANPTLPASLFLPPAADWPTRPLFTPEAPR